MILKNFIPPVFSEFIQKNRRIVKYKSYEEALSHCTADAYQNEELCNMIADKTLAYRELLNKEPFTVTPTSVYLGFALNYFVNAYQHKTLTVLDFGGACGAHYFEMRKLIPGAIAIKWIVVETEQMVSSALDHGFGKEELSFTTNVESIKESVDFVYSSSTLQYVPEPYTFLNKLIQVNARMILLNRMMFNGNNEDIITVQRSFLSSNGPGKLPQGYVDKLIMYPHTTMAINKVNSIMEKADYKCLIEFDEPSGKFALGKEKVLGKGLLYSKNIF